MSTKFEKNMEDIFNLPEKIEDVNNKNEIKQLINQINSLEGNIKDSIELDISKNKYHYFLLLGIFLFVIDFLFTFKVLEI